MKITLLAFDNLVHFEFLDSAQDTLVGFEWNWKFVFMIYRVASCCWQDRQAVERPPQSVFWHRSWASGSRSGQTQVTWSHTVAVVSMVRTIHTYINIPSLLLQVPLLSIHFIVPLIVLFFSEFRMNGLSYTSQSAQFREFLLRANKYNWLKIVGDDGTTDKKLILVEVCNLKYNSSKYSVRWGSLLMGN